jgi:hypothetical protein
MGVALLAAVLLASAPRQATAQATPRWLADPALVTPIRTIGPSSQQTFDVVSDMQLLSPSDGWAAAYGNLLRFDGRFWRPVQALTSTTSPNALEMLSPDAGWVVGGNTQRLPPYTSSTLIMRYAGGQWADVSDQIARADGSQGAITGWLSDVAALPGFALAIGATPSDVEFWNRPLVLAFDGAQWRDATPAEWRYGNLSHISMVSPNEGWATGLLGRPGGEGADNVRPVILHYLNGAWSEEQLPGDLASGIPFGMGQIEMVDSSEGWAVYRNNLGNCGVSQLLHRQAGAWSVVPTGYASVIALGLVPGTSRGWISLFGCSSRGQTIPSRRMHFDAGTLTPDAGGTSIVPEVYALLDDQHQWASAGGAMLRYSDEALLTERADAPAGARYFAETGHALAGEFRSYYESHGLELGDRGISARESLALFGYPLSEPFDEINPDTHEILRVQYFERARFELHPENQPPYRVLLGRLAFVALHGRNSSEPRIPNPDQAQPAPAGCRRFDETGYDLCAPLRGFWERSGGLPAFGLPITPAHDETSTTDGGTYLTQWFERERLEHHPELAGTPYEVLLGLLGSEELRRRGYLP